MTNTCWLPLIPKVLTGGQHGQIWRLTPIARKIVARALLLFLLIFLHVVVLVILSLIHDHVVTNDCWHPLIPGVVMTAAIARCLVEVTVAPKSRYFFCEVT